MNGILRCGICVIGAGAGGLSVAVRPGAGPLAFAGAARYHSGIASRSTVFRAMAGIGPVIAPRTGFADPEQIAIGAPAAGVAPTFSADRSADSDFMAEHMWMECRVASVPPRQQASETGR